MASHWASHRYVLSVTAVTIAVLVLYSYIYSIKSTVEVSGSIVANVGLSKSSVNDNCLTGYSKQHNHDACEEHRPANSVYLDNIITDDIHQVLYCFIRKVGCTSFQAMMVKNVGIETNKTWYPESYMNKVGLKQLSQYSRKDISVRLKNYFKFMVVRHPFDRLVSAYQQKFGGIKSYNLGLISHNFAPRYRNVIKKHFGEISKVDSKGEIMLSWPQFLELVATEPERFYNNHWASYEHLCNPCRVNYSHVVYMERMKDDIGIVLDRLKNPDGHRPTLPARNTIRDTTDRAAELSQHFKNIDPDILKRLLQIYGRDLELFGYTWNSESEAGYPKNKC